MESKKINLPFSDQEISEVKAGDFLELTGIIYTARDQAHKRLMESLKKGEISPIPTPNPVLYYCGPTPEKSGEVIGSAGPTTSSRMDEFTPYLMSKGFKISIGKGSRSPQIIESIKRYSGLYLAAFGGCGALYQKYIKSKKTIAYPELLAEAIYELKVENFPVVVAIAANGDSLF